MEIFYEDLMDNFDNNNLREKLMQLVNEHKIIIVKGLNSAQRHTIYRQMYYPLKFEKIVLNENDQGNTDIRIYNYKLKSKSVENKKETKKEKEYILEDSENSEEESFSQSENETESDDSYLTEEDEQLTKIEDIGSQILEITVNNGKIIDKVRSRVNLVIVFNIIGWIMLYVLDPVRVINIKTVQCESF